jgi:hypothetical protein
LGIVSAISARLGENTYLYPGTVEAKGPAMCSGNAAQVKSNSLIMLKVIRPARLDSLSKDRLDAGKSFEHWVMGLTQVMGPHVAA